LLELGRVLPHRLQEPDSQGKFRQFWLVFFDAEDNGRLPGWDWILGSRAFVAGLDGQPDAAVIIDMIGDANLDVYQEKNSDSNLVEQIWTQAAELGYGSLFIPQYQHAILDDHIPFRDAGIPAVDLIDFDYAYWHTTQDTPDKVSADSLQAVGDILLAWLMK
jgi:glutaminyl-peptide cyclotransferase